MTQNSITRRDFVGRVAGGMASIAGSGASARAGAVNADLVIHGIPTLTVDSANSVQGAIAIQGNRIVTVAKDLSGVQPMIGSGTRVVRLSQGCITPGMIDVHNHIVVQAANTVDWIDLMSVTSLEDVRQALARFVIEKNWPKGKWLRGAGYAWFWDKVFQPRAAGSAAQPQLVTRWDLDQVVQVGGKSVDLSQYPIFLIQISGHYASLNALALLKSKIMDKSGRFYRGSDAECLTVDGRSIGDTFSPEQRAFGSFFHMGQQGGSSQISGAIFHHYAMEEFFLRARKFADYPEMDEEELITALKQRSREFIRMGVTSIYDNNLRSVRFLDTVKRYPQIATPEEKLRLTLHPYICDLRRGAFPAFDSGARKGILSRTPPFQGEWVRLLGYKLQVDAAAMTGFTWEANRSFGGQEASRVNLWEYDDLLEIVREIDKTGAQISIHVIGDKALDWTLDAFEKAQVGTRDRRHRLEHLMVVPDESRNSLTRKSEPLMKRAANLGLVFCPQPGFILYYASFWENAYGSGVGRNKIQQSFPRMAHSVPYRSAVEAGVRVALSSDNPCVPNPSPLLALWESVHRRTQRLFYQGRLLLDTFNYNHEDAQGKLVDERVDFTQALRGHTIDAAYCGREEAIKGSLENGKLADLVVWNKDIRTLGERVPVTAVQDMKPVMTLIDGRIAYQDAAAGIKIERA